MKIGSFALVAMLASMTGCASYPVPAQHMADAEGAARAAQDVGASSNPQAQLHLKMAQEEIAQAKQLIADDDNEKADSVLIRAKADGELALAEARETQAQMAARQALAQIGQLNSENGTSQVTTTSAVISNSPPTPPASTTVQTTTTTTGGGK